MDQYTDRDKCAMTLALWAKGFSAKDIHATLTTTLQKQAPSLKFIYAACRRFKANDLTLDTSTTTPADLPPSKRPRAESAKPTPEPSAVPMDLDKDGDDIDDKTKSGPNSVLLERIVFCERMLKDYKGKNIDDIVTCADTQIKPEPSSKQALNIVVFFSRKEIIYADFTITDAKFDANHYIERALKPMIAVWKEKHPRLKLNRLILNHDNSPAHRAEKTKRFLEGAGIPTLLVPARSRDLLPGHFWLVPEIQKSLRFSSVLNLEEAKVAWLYALGRLTPDDFRECFNVWFKRMAIVVEKNGKTY